MTTKLRLTRAERAAQAYTRQRADEMIDDVIAIYLRVCDGGATDAENEQIVPLFSQMVDEELENSGAALTANNVRQWLAANTPSTPAFVQMVLAELNLVEE